MRAPRDGATHCVRSRRFQRAAHGENRDIRTTAYVVERSKKFINATPTIRGKLEALSLIPVGVNRALRGIWRLQIAGWGNNFCQDASSSAALQLQLAPEISI